MMSRLQIRGDLSACFIPSCSLLLGCNCNGHDVQAHTVQYTSSILLNLFECPMECALRGGNALSRCVQIAACENNCGG